MEKFMIDDDGILWVKIEGSDGYSCTGLLCEDGNAEEVWDSVPSGTEFPLE